MTVSLRSPDEFRPQLRAHVLPALSNTFFGVARSKIFHNFMTRLAEPASSRLAFAANGQMKIVDLRAMGIPPWPSSLPPNLR